jgi:hypothetical protein
MKQFDNFLKENSNQVTEFCKLYRRLCNDEVSQHKLMSEARAHEVFLSYLAYDVERDAIVRVFIDKADSFSRSYLQHFYIRDLARGELRVTKNVCCPREYQIDRRIYGVESVYCVFSGTQYDSIEKICNIELERLIDSCKEEV